MPPVDPWVSAVIGSLVTLIIGWLTYRQNEKKQQREAEAAVRDDSVALRREALESAETALRIMHQTLVEAADRCEELIAELRKENEELKTFLGRIA